MIVYVLMRGAYDEYEFASVHATVEAAQAAVDPPPAKGWEKVSEGWMADFDGEYDHARIFDAEVLA